MSTNENNKTFFFVFQGKFIENFALYFATHNLCVELYFFMNFPLLDKKLLLGAEEEK